MPESPDENMRSLTAVKKVTGYFIIFIFILIVMEVLSFLFFTLKSDQFTFYDRHLYLMKESDLLAMEEMFDPLLGWDSQYITKFGARPKEIDYDEDLISTFGDSYTYCDEVGDDETWQAYLARLIGKNVYNFGTPAHGTDQAYLKFTRDYPRVKTEIVTLGLIRENINRVVNVYRKFYYPPSPAGTKPRFVPGEDGLKLLPNPIEDVDELTNLQDPDFIDQLGENDYWYNTVYPVLEFPYLKIFFNHHFRMELRYGKGSNAINDITPRPGDDLWTDEQSVEIMFSLFDMFVHDAGEYGAIPVIMIFPQKGDVVKKYRNNKNYKSIQKIIDYCREKEYRYFDCNTALAAAAGSIEELNTYFAGHISVSGNKVIAEQFYYYLIDNNLLNQ